MNYKVEITETLSRIVDIEADSEEGALEKVRQAYKKEEIVLDANDYLDTEMKVYKN